MFEKNGSQINNRMIFVCHRLGKTTKTIVKFANRRDAELKVDKKKLKDVNVLEFCSNTEDNVWWNHMD